MFRKQQITQARRKDLQLLHGFYFRLFKRKFFFTIGREHFLNLATILCTFPIQVYIQLSYAKNNQNVSKTLRFILLAPQRQSLYSMGLLHRQRLAKHVFFEPGRLEVFLANYRELVLFFLLSA